MAPTTPQYPSAPSGASWQTVKQAAALTGLNERTIWRQVKAGKRDKAPVPNARNKPVKVLVQDSERQSVNADNAGEAASPAVGDAEIMALRIENAELKTRLSLVEGQLSDARDDLRTVENGRDALQSELIQLARQAQRGPLEKLLRAWRGT